MGEEALKGAHWGPRKRTLALNLWIWGSGLQLAPAICCFLLVLVGEGGDSKISRIFVLMPCQLGPRVSVQHPDG